MAAGCAPNATQSSLKPAGPYARDISNLFTPVFWIAAAIFFIVEGLLLYLAIRYRHRKGRQEIPPQIHGNNKLEIGWTILPALILVGVAVPTVSTIYDLAKNPGPNAVNVNVVGHQWWWEFDYPDAKIVTANELHIPTDRPVYLHLCSAGNGYDQKPAPNACQTTPSSVGDAVIHSFWVPELAGKQDVVPGRTNTMLIQADEPGVYTGQCAEFCGLSHAYMRFKVVAQAPADFDAWVRANQADAAVPAEGSLAATGLNDFLNGTCVACHAIQGTEAAANGGPNLTHFASRSCFAGCVFDNDLHNVETWLRDPPSMKPGSWMPNYHLSEEQIRALAAYLETLT
jgi:cytochrome c oxidase subunit 2